MKTSTSQLQIIDLKISLLSPEQIVEDFLTGKIKTITYCHFHSFNLANKDKFFRKYLNNFDIVHPDGFGMYVVTKFFSPANKLSKKITGSDIYPLLLNEMSHRKISLFVIGETERILNDFLIFLKKDFPGIKIKGGKNGYSKLNEEELNRIVHASPDFVIVGMGQPTQEKRIIDLKEHLPDTGLIAVGGGIKVLIGERKRGPRFIQNIGLEWMIKFLQEPRRLWKRYLIGIPLFLFRIIKEFIRNYDSK